MNFRNEFFLYKKKIYKTIYPKKKPFTNSSGKI